MESRPHYLHVIWISKRPLRHHRSSHQWAASSFSYKSITSYVDCLTGQTRSGWPIKKGIAQEGMCKKIRGSRSILNELRVNEVPSLATQDPENCMNYVLLVRKIFLISWCLLCFFFLSFDFLLCWFWHWGCRPWFSIRTSDREVLIGNHSRQQQCQKSILLNLAGTSQQMKSLCV